MVSQTITSWSKPSLQSYIPTDWFRASSSLPAVSDSELEASLKKIKEQVNAIRVLRANLGLAKAVIATDKNVMAVEAQLEANAIHAQKMNMKVDFERTKLEMDRGGYAQLGAIYGQQWQKRIAAKQAALNKDGKGSGQPQPQPQPATAGFFQGDRLDMARFKAQEMRGYLKSVEV